MKTAQITTTQPRYLTTFTLTAPSATRQVVLDAIMAAGHTARKHPHLMASGTNSDTDEDHEIWQTTTPEIDFTPIARTARIRHMTTAEVWQ